MDTNEPTLALISDDTFIVDGKRHPGVITVQRFEDDHIEITIQLLGQVDIAIEVILDTNDLMHIKHLLASQDLAGGLRPSEAAQTTVERLATIERRQEEDAETFGEHARRLGELETVVANLAIHGLRAHVYAISDRVDDLMERLAVLDRLNIGGRVAYLERALEGRTGPEAGL